ncbi:MAG: HAD family hydrolase [Clostridia bacterium]|nr:HAD family hydrolase [Clostridia bacterium]
MLKAIWFDLDGTLLPMESLDEFIAAFLRDVSAKAAPLGFEPKALAKAVWEATGAVIANDGSRPNDEVFHEVIRAKYGNRAADLDRLFDEYYRGEFNDLAQMCGRDPVVAETVAALKQKGLTLVLASKPIFPLVAQEARMRWAGVDPADFAHITGAENCAFCKPAPAYYAEILGKLGLRPEECLMIGNDVDDDLTAEKVGVPVFLTTDWLINRPGKDIAPLPHGTFKDVLGYVEGLMK